MKTDLLLEFFSGFIFSQVSIPECAVFFSKLIPCFQVEPCAGVVPCALVFEFFPKPCKVAIAA